MEYIRITGATLAFVVGTFLIMGLFLVEFYWEDMLAGVLFYLFAYAIWPSKKRGKRDSDNYLIDTVELVVEFPIEMIIWLFRALSRLFGSSASKKDNGVDLDIDF